MNEEQVSAMGSVSRVAVALVVVALAGCASAPPPPPDQYYRIYTEETVAHAASPSLDGVLVVRRFLSDGLLGDRPVVYAAGDAENPLLQYHYHHWADSPTRMLQEALVPYLRDAGIATQVVTPEVPVDAEFELVGKIRRLEQVRGERPRVVLDLEFVLTEARGSSLLWLQSYAVEVPCADDTLVAAVAAFNEAVSEVFASVVRDIRAQAG